MEPKPLASLSSGLLARKGGARPAMRRPSINGQGGAAALAMDDLGWNDMGYDVDPDQSVPMDHDHDLNFNPLANAVPEVKPEVRIQQERIAEQLHVQAEQMVDDEGEPTLPATILPFEAPVQIIAAVKQRSIESAVRKPRAAAGQKAKSAFTLRLDGERHLKLRLACAVSNRSAQQLVTAALDAFIEEMPEIGQLASQLPNKQMRHAE
jgi:hypothetical protein